MAAAQIRYFFDFFTRRIALTHICLCDASVKASSQKHGKFNCQGSYLSVKVILVLLIFLLHLGGCHSVEHELALSEYPELNLDYDDFSHPESKLADNTTVAKRLPLSYYYFMLGQRNYWQNSSGQSDRDT